MSDDLDRLLDDLGMRDPLAPASQRAAPAPARAPPPQDDLSRFLAGKEFAEEAPAEDRPADDSDLRVGAQGFADTAAFGLADEVGGFAQTLGLSSRADPRESVWSSERSFGDILSGNIARNRQNFKHDSEHHLGAQLTGQVAGGIIMPLGSGARGALQVARVGGAQGLAYGLGSGEGVEDRLVKGAEYGAGGFLLGGAIGKVVERVSPAVGRFFGRTPKVAGEVEDAGAAAVDDLGEGLSGRTADESPWEPGAWSHPDGQGERVPIGTQLTDEEDELFWLMKPDDVVDDDPFPWGMKPEDAVEPTTIPPRSAAKVAEGTEEAASAGAPIGSISRAGLQDLQEQVDAFRMRVGVEGERVVDVPEGAAQGAFRLGNLGDGPDTMSLLGALVRQLPSKGTRSDAELMATAKQASDELGMGDPEAVLALAQEMAGKLGDADTGMAILRTVVRRAGDDIELFHGAGIDWATASDEVVQQAGSAIYNSQRLNSLLQSAKVGVGRALRVNALPDADSYLQALAKGEPLEGVVAAERTVPPLPTNREELSNFFELWGLTKGNPEMQTDLLAGTLTVPTSRHYLAHSFANFFTASILSAPKTLMLNLIGPSVVNTVRALEKMGGGALGAINLLSTPAQRAAQAAVAKNTPLALMHTLGDIRDVFRYGVQAFQENRAMLGGGGSVRDANISFGPYNSNLLNAAGVDPNWKYSLGNALNLFPKALARVNAGLDEMSKRFTYLNEVRVRSMVEAAERGLEGEEARSHVAQIMKASVDEAGAATDAGLLSAAERSTLTGHPGAEGTFPRQAVDMIQTLRKDHPALRFLLPVFNVPANAVGETLRRIPVVNRHKWMVEHAADLAGNNGAVSQAEAHGRTLLGASFLMGGYLLNQAGILTGAGPQNPTDAKIWRQTHEPYSFRVGDTWVSYRKLDILGGLLSIPATLSDLSVYHRVEDRSMWEAMLVGAGSLAQWFRDQGAMRNATLFLALGDDPTRNTADTVEQFLGQVSAALVVPASGLVRSLGVDTTDPYTRLKQDWDDYIRAGIPGLSQELEPLRNVLGEPINRPANSLGEALFPVTMAPVQTYAREPVLDELTRLYQLTGYGAGADPKALGYGHFDPQEVKLEDGRSLYFHAMQARATMRLEGWTLKETLQDLFDSPEYADAVDADASQRETSRGDQSRGYLIRSVFDRYNKAIKAEVASASPIALRYLTAAAAKQRDDAYLRAVSLEDLVANPALYEANGIDPTAYSDAITDGAVGDLLEALGRGPQ